MSYFTTIKTIRKKNSRVIPPLREAQCFLPVFFENVWYANMF